MEAREESSKGQEGELQQGKLNPQSTLLGSEVSTGEIATLISNLGTGKNINENLTPEITSQATHVQQTENISEQLKSMKQLEISPEGLEGSSQQAPALPGETKDELEVECGSSDKSQASSCLHSPEINSIQQIISCCEELLTLLRPVSIGVEVDETPGTQVSLSCPAVIFYRLVALTFHIVSVSLKPLCSMSHEELAHIMGEDGNDSHEKFLSSLDKATFICQRMASEAKVKNRNYLSYAMTEDGKKQPDEVHDEIMKIFQKAYEMFYIIIQNLDKSYGEGTAQGFEGHIAG